MILWGRFNRCFGDIFSKKVGLGVSTAGEAEEWEAGEREAGLAGGAGWQEWGAVGGAAALTGRPTEVGGYAQYFSNKPQ
jgi:hypothetical protein